jgi:hypothetical protein
MTMPAPNPQTGVIMPGVGQRVWWYVTGPAPFGPFYADTSTATAGLRGAVAAVGPSAALWMWQDAMSQWLRAA